MGVSRIFVTASQTQASQIEGTFRSTSGYHVAVITSTDGCEVDDILTGAAVWQPTGNGPWYVVIATPDQLKLATAS